MIYFNLMLLFNFVILLYYIINYAIGTEHRNRNWNIDISKQQIYANFHNYIVCTG